LILTLFDMMLFVSLCRIV